MRFILILLTVLSMQAPQTGSIDGTVVRYGTSDGISRAKVTLTPVGSSAQGRAMIVDSDGKFAFHNLAAGQYRISASRDGYVNSDYGQRGPNGSGSVIALATQQSVTDIRIGMTSTGAIGGRIMNRYGEPMGNVNVQALRYSYQDGRRMLNSVQTVRTNDRGEYRLFWMTPGQYVVSAQPAEQMNLDSGGTMFLQTARGGGTPGLLAGGVTRIMVTGTAATADIPGLETPGNASPPLPPPLVDNPEAYLPVYYPGTTEIAAATPIDLRAGGSMEGINLTVADVHPVRIRGQVLSGGRPAAGAQVSLYLRSTADGSLNIRGTTASDMGQFEYRNVAPGAYELAASVNAPGGLIMFAPLPGGGPGVNATSAVPARANRNSGQPVQGIRVPVDVGTADIDSLALNLETGFNVTGKITVEGRVATNTAPNLTGVRIQLQSDPMIPPLAIPPGNPDAEGLFAISGVTSGIYRLNISGLPQNMYLKSARLLGIDVLSNGFRINGEPRASLEIVLGATPGSLEVIALDDRQMPAAGVTVVLVPDANSTGRNLFRNGTSDASGKVQWDNVAPGDYKVYAWEDVENGSWTDAEFMHPFEGRGKPVRIEDRGRANVSVTAIPYKAN